LQVNLQRFKSNRRSQLIHAIEIAQTAGNKAPIARSCLRSVNLRLALCQQYAIGEMRQISRRSVPTSDCIDDENAKWLETVVNEIGWPGQVARNTLGSA